MDLEKIKKRIRPDEKAIWKKTKAFVSRLESLASKSGVKAAIEVGGSLAKGTLLKGDHDVDIFVKFPKKYATDKLSDYLEKMLRPLKPVRVHGSRDYFQIKLGGMQYEIVPVYNINNAKESINITDASPLHARWVNSQSTKKEELKDEIRLAKLFCKARGIYGAESYIKGFSGHVLDIITIYYGSFEKLMRHAAKWKKNEVIDFYDKYRGSALKKLNRSKTQSPLIVIDPIDPSRNASAALGKEMFEKFTNAAKEFIKNPSEKFFERKKFCLGKIKKKNAVIVSVSALKGKKDVVGSKLLKAFEGIKKQLELNGFEITGSGWHWNKKAYFWYRFKKMKILKTYVHEGPPVNAKKNLEQFREKHPDCFVKGKRAYARIQRKHTDAEIMVRDVLKKEFIKKNFKTAVII